MVGVAFATAALIIVLSVFNGLEDLLRSLYGSFDPELKIEASTGKSFEVSPQMLSSLRGVPGVEIVTEVIEDYAYARYRESDMVVTIKGVSDNFIDQHRIDDHIDEGTLKLHDKGSDLAILGRGVKYTLSVNLDDDFNMLQIFYIKNLKAGGTMDPSRLYSRKGIRPGAVFSIEKTYDENYIFLPLEFVKDLLEYGDRRTALEIKTTESANISDVQNQIRNALGPGFAVLTNEEQHKDLYRLLKIEKLFTFLSLSMLITIGSINIFFSLMMLAIDKKKDISILSALGAGQGLVRRIFLTEGALISFVGAAIGLLLGGILCYLQDRFGWVGMGMANAVVSSYPVKMKLVDFASTCGVVIVVTFLVSIYPASKASRFYAPELL